MGVVKAAGYSGGTGLTGEVCLFGQIKAKKKLDWLNARQNRSNLPAFAGFEPKKIKK
jgi:hypothetical protein